MNASDADIASLCRLALERGGTVSGGPALIEMPVPPVGITESAFTAAVIALAQANKWRTAHFRAGMNRRGKWMTAVQGDGAGFPDLVLVRERVIVCELKVGRNKPTDRQHDWLAAFRAAGIEAYVWLPDDWPTIEAVLGIPSPSGPSTPRRKPRKAKPTNADRTGRNA